MTRVLLLRSGGNEEGGEPLPEGVDLLVTHEVACRPEGVDEALEALCEGASAGGADAAAPWTLVVTSRSTVRCLAEGASAGGADRSDRAGRSERGFFRRPWGAILAAGSGTAAALAEAGAPRVEVPGVPGAAGLVPALLSRADASPLRVLWPRGSDADTAPFAPVKGRASLFRDPVVYEKRPLPPPRELLDRLACGAWDAVAVSSLASLDVVLSALAAASLAPPKVRWGAVGPATARAFAVRGLPEPEVPARPRLSDLVAKLTETEQR